MRNFKEIKPCFPRGKLCNDLLAIPRKGEQCRVFRLFVCLFLVKEQLCVVCQYAKITSTSRECEGPCCKFSLHHHQILQHASKDYKIERSFFFFSPQERKDI